MKINKVKNKFVFLVVLFFAFLALPAKAICPVCTVAVGAGVGLTRYLGVEDTITGVWIGGLIMSLSFWTLNWLERKNWKFPARKILIISGYYLLTIIPLFWLGISGHPTNKLCGVDKLLLGSFSGSLGFIFGLAIHLKLKKKNNGQAHFPFQKVALSIFPLLILSAVFYIISKC